MHFLRWNHTHIRSRMHYTHILVINFTKNLSFSLFFTPYTIFNLFIYLFHFYEMFNGQKYLFCNLVLSFYEKKHCFYKLSNCKRWAQHMYRDSCVIKKMMKKKNERQFLRLKLKECNKNTKCENICLHLHVYFSSIGV